MSLAEVLPVVEQLTQENQMALYRILAEKLEPFKLPFPLQPNKIYYVYSPYDAYGAGKALMEAKEKFRVESRKERQKMSLAEVLPTIEGLSEDDQKLLFHILAEKFVPIPQPIPSQPKKIYYLYTPYNMYGAARLMREAKERKRASEA